jgi:lactoylglutathione lyase
MIEFILYVADQERSKIFYRTALGKEPDLDVPGMTEFILAENVKLGLMPESGITKILGDKTPHPAAGNGIPRCELYLYTTKIEEWYQRLQTAGAREISGIEVRSWGDKVCYFSDMDGHIIAIAEKM